MPIASSKRPSQDKLQREQYGTDTEMAEEECIRLEGQSRTVRRTTNWGDPLQNKLPQKRSTPLDIEMNLPSISYHKFQSRITKGAFLAQRHNDHHNTNIVRALLPRYKDITCAQDFQVVLKRQTVCCTQYVEVTYYVWSIHALLWSYHVYNVFWHYPLLISETFDLYCKQNSSSTL